MKSLRFGVVAMVVCALVVLLSGPPAFAQVTSGSVTQFGHRPLDNNNLPKDGNAQVRILGSVAGSIFGYIDPDEGRDCTVELLNMLAYTGQELVTDKNGTALPEFLEDQPPLNCRNSAREMNCKSDQRARPTFSARIKDRLAGKLEFDLKVDRAVIATEFPGDKNPEAKTALTTAFDIVCFQDGVEKKRIQFSDDPEWCFTGNSGGSRGVNIRPCPD